MSQNPNGPTPDQEQGRAFGVAILILATILFLISYFSEYVSAAVGAIAYIHVFPIGLLVEYVPDLRSIPYLGPLFFSKIELTKLFLEQGNFAYMTTSQRLDVLTAAGYAAFIIYAPLFLYAGIFGRQFRPDLKFKTAYSLEHMIWTQSENWKTSRISRHVNPLKKDEVSAGTLVRQVIEGTEKLNAKKSSVGHLIQPGRISATAKSWHRSLRPEEWLIAHGLCIEDKHVNRARAKDWKYPSKLLEARDTWQDLDLDTLMEVLSLQIRTPWTGFDALEPHKKALCAVMASFYDYDIKKGNQLLEELALINDSVKSKPKSMDSAILKEEGFMQKIEDILSGSAGKNLSEIANKHAWVETAFPAMLTFARKDRGVLPSAAFLWLKSEDRTLWYIMNAVGSEAIMIEAAGAMAHFRAETQIGKPIYRPATYQAARALLEDYLDITEERIVSKSAKRDRTMTPGQKINRILGKEDD